MVPVAESDHAHRCGRRQDALRRALPRHRVRRPGRVAPRLAARPDCSASGCPVCASTASASTTASPSTRGSTAPSRRCCRRRGDRPLVERRRRTAHRLRRHDAADDLGAAVVPRTPRSSRCASGVDDGRPSPSDRDAEWVDIAVPPEPFDVINNVGSNLFAGGFGGDRGFLEVDTGQYEEPADVFAWCGGAVLLSRAYLDEVGTFDERFFLYYEDTDLSWRGQLRGWRYVYEPGAVVRHHHAQSSGVGSPLFRYSTERNRLLMLAKNAPAQLAWRSGLGEVRRAVTSTIRHYVLRPLTLRLPVRARGGPPLARVRRLPPTPAGDAARPVGARASVGARRRHAVGGRQVAEDVSGRLRVGVYDLYWSTLGGGEQVDGSIAQVLAGGPRRHAARAAARPTSTQRKPARRRPVGVRPPPRRRRRRGERGERRLRRVRQRHVPEQGDQPGPARLLLRALPRRGADRARDHAPQPGRRRRCEGAVARAARSRSASPRCRRRSIGACAASSSCRPTPATSPTRSSPPAGSNSCGARPTDVLYPPVRPSVRPGEKQPLILVLGRFFDPKYGHSKKQHELLETFRGLHRSGRLPGWRMAIVGGCDATNRDYALAVRRGRTRAAGRRARQRSRRGSSSGSSARRRSTGTAPGLGEDPATPPRTVRALRHLRRRGDGRRRRATRVRRRRARPRSSATASTGATGATLDQLAEQTVALVADEAASAVFGASAIGRAQTSPPPPSPTASDHLARRPTPSSRDTRQPRLPSGDVAHHVDEDVGRAGTVGDRDRAAGAELEHHEVRHRLAGEEVEVRGGRLRGAGRPCRQVAPRRGVRWRSRWRSRRSRWPARCRVRRSGCCVPRTSPNGRASVPSPHRLSTNRSGVIVVTRPPPGPKLPSTSTITSALVSATYRLIWPPAPTFTTDVLARTPPAVSSRSMRSAVRRPSGYAVTYPAPGEPTIVMFTTTLSAFAGTPETPATFTLRVSPAANWRGRGADADTTVETRARHDAGEAGAVGVRATGAEPAGDVGDHVGRAEVVEDADLAAGADTRQHQVRGRVAVVDVEVRCVRERAVGALVVEDVADPWPPSGSPT